MGLTVQIVLDEEVAFLLEVDAAVIAHEALRVVELVPGLHDGATGWGDEGKQSVLDLRKCRNHGDPSCLKMFIITFYRFTKYDAFDITDNIGFVYVARVSFIQCSHE